MPTFDEVESDLFFDSLDCLSPQGSIVNESLEYKIWINEPQSVKDRRRSFLSEIGFINSASKTDEIDGTDQRIAECSGAVSSSLGSYTEELDSVCCLREANSEANSMVDYDIERDHFDEERVESENVSYGSSFSIQEPEYSEGKDPKTGNNRMKRWWEYFIKRRNETEGRSVSNVSRLSPKEQQKDKMKVKYNSKRCMEFTGVYKEQEIQAHKGFIWTMKFSPDGKYLATGGEDGIVRVWRVSSVESSSKSFTYEDDLGGSSRGFKSNYNKKKKSHASVVIPNKIFQIEESAVHELHGHKSDVLDLSWSTSNCLLSASKDQTVRMWRVGSNRCQNVFRHSNYVTCVQFDPMNENYFISGSIDGKVRIWGVDEERVADWADISDVVTAVCYQPDGKGFVVGSINGTCRFYEETVNELQLQAEIRIQSRKKSFGNRITGIQFLPERSQRVVITSEDSKVRIFDGVDLVKKYKGLPRSGSQMSASFTSSGRHMISVGEDSRVYIWNYNGLCTPISKNVKSVRSCEHFLSEGVSVAIPWSQHSRGCDLGSVSQPASSRVLADEVGGSWRRDSERFSIGSWLFMEGSCMGASVTWPEEKLPLWEAECLEGDNEGVGTGVYKCCDDFAAKLSEAWGLVIVTAGADGMIRTFHNYGLPIRN